LHAVFFWLPVSLTPQTNPTAGIKQATATCRAEVKERAKYHEMSWYAQHKAVKNCVKEALAKH